MTAQDREACWLFTGQPSPESWTGLGSGPEVATANISIRQRFGFTTCLHSHLCAAVVDNSGPIRQDRPVNSVFSDATVSFVHAVRASWRHGFCTLASLA